MANLKLYSDIKTKSIAATNHIRVDFAQSLDWDAVFGGHDIITSSDIKKMNTYTGGAEVPYVNFFKKASYFEDESLKGKYPVEKKTIIVTNKYPITFDIETNPDGTSWIQQFTINNHTILCHGWDEAMQMFNIIDYWMEMNDAVNPGTYTVATVLIANLGFEFQYLRKRLDFTSVFATGGRKPLSAQTNRIYFRDPLRLSNSSLAKLSDLYDLPTKKAFEEVEEIVNGKKKKRKVMDLDYSIPRTTKWKLSDKEHEYVCNDVEILGDFWRWCVDNYVANGYKIPQTATGIDRDTVNKLAKAELEWYEPVLDKKGNPILNKNGTPKMKHQISKFARILPKLFPETLEEYDDLMMMTFVGGYTKSNFLYTGVELTNVNGGDFTSSYPAVMFNHKFPMKKFYKLDPAGVTLERIVENEPDLATIAKIRFKNLRAKTTHSIQSISKTYEYVECGRSTSSTIETHNMIVDNGRVFYADQCTVSLTELDIATFLEFYTWSDYEILTVQCAEKDYLPDYIRYAVVLYYQLKAILKKAGLDGTTEYRIAKAMVNALYGMMCEKIHIVQDCCNPKADEDCWYKDTANVDREHLYKCQIYGLGGDPTDNDDYLKQVSNIEKIESGKMVTRKYLSPYWAVYVTAHARRNLLKNVNAVIQETGGWDGYENENDSVIYCDTDSMYFIDGGAARKVMQEWNEKITARNHAVAAEWNARHNFDEDYYKTLSPEDAEKYLHETRGVVVENIDDLGTFDILNPLGNYTRFKTLGAKRYLKTGPHKDKKTGEIYDETVATIAGLPKTALLDYCDQTGKDPYDVFNDGMCIPQCKKAHEYHDEEYETIITDSQGNTEVMHEYSSIVIKPIDFSMKLSKMYKDIISTVGSEMRFSNTELLNIAEELINRLDAIIYDHEAK